MKTARLWAILLFLCLLVQGDAFPQTADSTLNFAASRNWVIRVSSGGHVLAEGNVLGFKQDSVIFRSVRIAIGSITDIDRRTRSGGGAWSGAAAVGLAVGGFFALMVAAFCEYECTTDVVVGAAFGFATGGTIGALLGEVISPAKRGWQRIWHKPEEP